MYQLDSELAQKGIKPRHYDVGSQKIKCPECQPHRHNNRDNPLSLTINPDYSAVWNCHHCDFKGGVGNKIGIKTFKKKYVKPVVPVKKTKDNFLYSFFEKRGISKETVDAFKIFNEGDWVAFQYFGQNGTLCNVKYRTVKKNFRQSPNAKRIIYNYDRVCKTDHLVFVEGEMDVLSCHEVGYQATTLPDGAPSEAKYDKNDARFKALENSPLEAKKVILFLDQDKSGQALHSELLHRFGKDICWYVELPDNCKDANDVLVKHGKDVLKRIIQEAVPYPIDGLYTTEDYRNHVIDLYEGNYTKPVEIGMGKLDDIYKIMKGTLTIMTGIPNHGKSIFLDQILLSLSKNHNWRFAIFSPEHSTQLHIRRLAQMYKEKSFDEGFSNRMTREELDDALAFIQDHFFFIETRDALPSVELIVDIAKKAVFKYGCHLVIDPFNEVSAKRGQNQREDEYIRDFISTLKRFARVYESWVAVVAHPTKLPKANDGSYLPPTAYDISGAAHWHNMSDAVLTIHRDFEENSVSVLTRKIREQDLYGSIGTAKFYYDLEKKCFIEKESIDWDTTTI
tara:strand:+ start:4825 stop:6516 length:1692 start_codon:yes stop_codon:yes gene_type:complete